MKSIIEALRPTLDRSFVDLDPIFNHNLDEDFDSRASGITRASFCSVYMEWIQYCYSKRHEGQQTTAQKQPEDDKTGKTSTAQQPHVPPQNPTNSTGSADGISNIEMKSTSPRSSGNPTPSPRTSKTSDQASSKTARSEDSNESEIVSVFTKSPVHFQVNL